MAIERTLVLVKPDGVARRLVGEILSRFERAGLTIERMELVQATPERIMAHYPSSETWLRSVGEKTREAYARDGLDIAASFGSDDPLAIGRTVKSWLSAYMTGGPVVALMLSGNRAVELVRKLVGHTFPSAAAPGTIRGDYALDSPEVANAARRSIHNLVHASGSVAEAEEEIALWFGERPLTR
ncbi:MAG: nucleoside-diphosphate kinase [Myxococcales bacterium]|nr:MAG: nucleoside-diphosphate kinase [Myxococcales bacterium]